MANGEIVSLDEAKAMTAAYRAAHPNEVKAQLYDKGLIEQVLNQQGCVGIRIYHGIDNGNLCSVIVGVDAQEEDMHNGIILEKGTLCPPKCSTRSLLNG